MMHTAAQEQLVPLESTNSNSIKLVEKNSVA
jgi:hypothetical protein